MLTAMDVSRYFLSLSDDDAGDCTSNLKLQKLLYYAQGLHLACFDRPLFSEDLEAWMHGPVVPCVYHAYKSYGSDPVKLTQGEDVPCFDAETNDFLESVYSNYGQYSAWKLRNMTHDERPWKETPTGKVISRKLLREFFEDYVTDGEESNAETSI